MTKIWNKGYDLDAIIENYTVSDDYLLDQNLVKYDCIASLAHAKMLHKIGILTDSELDSLDKGLQEIIGLWEKGQFEILKSQEDCHTAIESYLTQHYGDAGRKIHTGRSRNDQVLVTLKLFAKHELTQITQAAQELIAALDIFSKTHKETPIPGRTHMQLAMPASLGLWSGAISKSLADDIVFLQAAFKIIDQCPLGSASSFGVALPLDRQFVSNELGFERLQNNVLYCANSRGKWESMALSAYVQIMLTLSKAANDLIFFSLPELAYVSLPKELCSGSSLMPQKKNPDALELVRAKSATVQGNLVMILETIRPLISGYNRDFQETKRPFLQSTQITKESLWVMTHTIQKLQVSLPNCLAAFKPELFAADWVMELVTQGMPFRTAYQQVAQNPQGAPHQDPIQNIRNKNL
ncbi:MAG: argininosuccinate lyase [Myxococcaceae bacterium]